MSFAHARNEDLRLVSYILVATLITTCSSPPDLLERVLETGELKVVTRNSPTAYLLGPDGPRGPEYDLVQAFADELDVRLLVKPVDNVAEVVPSIVAGHSYMAAAGLSVTESRRELINFGYSYQTLDMHLVYRLGTGKPRSPEDIVGRPIEIVADSSHVDVIERLKKRYPGIEYIENAEAEVADLLARVAAGRLDLTVADSIEFSIQRHFYPDLRIALDLELNDKLAWAFPKGYGDSLLERADEFLIAAECSGMLARIQDRYYGHTEAFDYVGTRSFIRHYESRLPRFRAWFEQAGAEWDVDWRLLAAIGYQESHWRTQAVSPTGVRGIMMLTLDTAAFLDIDDRLDPRNSIFGGAEYFARQMDRVADTVPEPDRTWMALAAYNVGFNHVKSAQQITEWRGGDLNTWIDVSRSLPLLAQRKWYSRVPTGYARGWEPVLYVNNVRQYYSILKWLTDNETIEPAEVVAIE